MSPVRRMRASCGHVHDMLTTVASGAATVATSIDSIPSRLTSLRSRPPEVKTARAAPQIRP